MSEPVYRPVTPDDVDFLWEMLVAAAAWDRPDSPFTTAEVRRIPDYAKYVEEWGRPGDHGIVAELDGETAGAAWLRRWNPETAAFGFVAADVPELIVGVREAHRGQGLGSALVRTLFDQARAQGIATVSLSVEKANPALRLYERMGFEVVRDDPAAYVMTIDLLAPTYS